jgi:hypothetical protein
MVSALPEAGGARPWRVFLCPGASVMRPRATTGEEPAAVFPTDISENPTINDTGQMHDMGS